MANEISTSLTMTEMVEDVSDAKANINIVTPIEFETQIRIDARVFGIRALQSLTRQCLPVGAYTLSRKLNQHLWCRDTLTNDLLPVTFLKE